MKPIPEGYEATFDLIVRDDMTVDFEQDPPLGKLHPVYATYWMTKHMELVSRKVILPFLEVDEEGIGFEVSVKHVASALPGMRVSVSAEHVETENVKIENHRVYTRCEAYNELGNKLGEGKVTQVILKRERLESLLTTLQTRWDTRKKSK